MFRHLQLSGVTNICLYSLARVILLNSCRPARLANMSSAMGSRYWSNCKIGLTVTLKSPQILMLQPVDMFLSSAVHPLYCRGNIVLYDWDIIG